MTPSGSTRYIDTSTVPAMETALPSGNPAHQEPAAFSGPLATAIAAAKAVGPHSGGGGPRSGTRTEDLPRGSGALPESGNSLPEDHGPNGLGMSEAASLDGDAPELRARPRLNEPQADVIWQSRNEQVPAPGVIWEKVGGGDFDPRLDRSSLGNALDLASLSLPDRSTSVPPSNCAASGDAGVLDKGSNPRNSDGMTPTETSTGPLQLLGPDTVLPGSSIDGGPAMVNATLVKWGDHPVSKGPYATSMLLDSAVQALPSAQKRNSAWGMEAEPRIATAGPGASLEVRTPSRPAEVQPASPDKGTTSENASLLSHLAMTRAFEPRPALDSTSVASLARRFEQVATRQSPETRPATEVGIGPSGGTRGLPEATLRLSGNLDGVTTLSAGSGLHQASSAQPTFHSLSASTASGVSGREPLGNGLDAPRHRASEVLDRTFGPQAYRASDPSSGIEVQAPPEVTGQPPASSVSAVQAVDSRFNNALGPVAATLTTDGIGLARVRPRTAEQMSLEAASPVASSPGDLLMSSVAPPGPLEAPPILEPRTELGTGLPEGESVEDAVEKTIVRHIAWMTRAGVSEAQLRLDPRELGSLDIRVSVRDDQATVSFAASEAPVREVLQEQTERLRELLGERGLALAESNIRNGFGSERGRTSDQNEHARGSEPTDAQNSDSTTSPERLLDSGGSIDAYA